MSLSQQCVLVAKETHPGVQEQSSARAQGGHPAPLLYPAEASPGIFCPPSVPQYMELLERVQQGISEMNNGVEHLSYVERLKELDVFSQDKRWEWEGFSSLALSVCRDLKESFVSGGPKT